MKYSLLIFLFFLSINLMGNNITGESTINWKPSKYNDGVAFDLDIKWRLSEFANEVRFEIYIKSKIVGQTVFYDGIEYSKSYLGDDVFNNVKPTLSNLSLEFVINGFPIIFEKVNAGSAYISKGEWFGLQGLDTWPLTGISQTENDILLEQFRNKKLGFDSFKIKSFGFGGLGQLRVTIEQLKRLEQKKNQEERVKIDSSKTNSDNNIYPSYSSSNKTNSDNNIYPSDKDIENTENTTDSILDDERREKDEHQKELQRIENEKRIKEDIERKKREATKKFAQDTANYYLRNKETIDELAEIFVKGIYMYHNLFIEYDSNDLEVINEDKSSLRHKTYIGFGLPLYPLQNLLYSWDLDRSFRDHFIINFPYGFTLQNNRPGLFLGAQLGWPIEIDYDYKIFRFDGGFNIEYYFDIGEENSEAFVGSQFEFGFTLFNVISFRVIHVPTLLDAAESNYGNGYCVGFNWIY